jgi:hypothetical protein
MTAIVPVLWIAVETKVASVPVMTLLIMLRREKLVAAAYM